MIKPETFIKELNKRGVTFFTGVPDSLLKEFLSCLGSSVPKEKHVTAANEGNAVAIAAGYYLATRNLAVVYMQNSGLGNAVNPLVSLADRDVYAIPVLLMIGWRGEPGGVDEPQHIVQGKITEDMLKILRVPYAKISSDMDELAITKEIEKLINLSLKEKRPCALLIRRGVFEKYHKLAEKQHQSSLTREQAIEIFLENIEKEAIVVSTTGKISRELYELRKKRGENTQHDFLTVGSMGHASQIALGIALQKRERPVYCLDGDGAAIMHLGGLATIGWVNAPNFRHLVLNNLAHESVGGQPSAAKAIDLTTVAKGCGYIKASSVNSKRYLVTHLAALRSSRGPNFLEIRVNLESRDNLSRPQESPSENKEGFINFVGQ